MVNIKKIKLNLLSSKLFEHSINLWLYRKFLICQCLDTDFCPIRIYTPEILSSRGRSMLLIQPTRLTTILQQFWVMFFVMYILREMEKNAKLHVFFWCRFLFWARHIARHFLGLSLLRILFPFLALFMLLYKRQSWDRSRSIYVCVRRELVLSCPWDYVYMTRLFFISSIDLFHTREINCTKT